MLLIRRICFDTAQRQGSPAERGRQDSFANQNYCSQSALRTLRAKRGQVRPVLGWVPMRVMALLWFELGQSPIQQPKMVLDNLVVGFGVIAHLDGWSHLH